jgi:hypothetical protein
MVSYCYTADQWELGTALSITCRLLYDWRYTIAASLGAAREGVGFELGDMYIRNEDLLPCCVTRTLMGSWAVRYEGSECDLTGCSCSNH